MAFGQELKDFADGFKIGRGVVEDSLDRKERAEARKEDRDWREEGRAIEKSRYATTLERQIAQDKRQAERDEKNDARYDDETTHRRFREGIQDERYFQNEADQNERQDRQDSYQERRLKYLEDKDKYPEGQINIDPNAVPQGSGAIPDGDKVSSAYTPDWLEYANQSATRSQPLAPQLVSALDKVAPALGVKVRVFSGGQDSEGPNRTGSHRHDHGGAGDIFLEKDGRQLSWENPKDRPIFEQFVSLSKKAGLTGFGAGEGYMQPGSMHVGFGKPAVWGAGGSGDNAAGWLKQAYAGGYANGGMVKSFALGGAIDDGEPEYEPTRIPIASLMGGQPQEEKPEQVAEAVPTNVPTPTPRPEYGGAGVVTSEGNSPTPAEEPATDDPYELGRRSVRDGLKRAIQEAGANDNGAINDPQSDEAHKKYLTGYGAAPRTLVQQAVQAVDPDKKMRPGERNLAAMGQVYKHYMDAGQPEKAVAAASSMVQYYRQESNRYLALAQAAAVKGDLPAAAKAAVAAYTNIPNGRDIKITPKGEDGAGGYEIKVTNEDGKVINTKVVNPQEFAAAAIGFNPATFDEEILNAAGEKTEKFDDITPDNRSKVDELIGPLVDQLQDPKIIGNPNMLSTVKNLAGDIGSVTQNKISTEQSVKLAVAIASADPKDVELKGIRGNPDRVRVTVDGQSVVMTKNALADLSKTAGLARADEATKKAATDASNQKYKDAGAAFNKAREQFQLQADDNAATQRGAAVGAAIGSMADDGAPKPQTEAVPSFTSPSTGDTGAPRTHVPSFTEPVGGGAIPEAPTEAPVTAQGNSGPKSIVIMDKGVAVIIPTVAPGGETLSPEAAMEMYRQTGKHLGKFRSEKEAAERAQSLQ